MIWQRSEKKRVAHMPRRAATEEVLGAADPVIKERHEMTLMLLRGDWFTKNGACSHWRICR
jgi:hypothetical protein